MSTRITLHSRISLEERNTLKIQSLPGTLEEAIVATQESELVRNTLGDHVFETLLANKRVEWDSYRIHVSEYEIDKYMSML